MIGDTVAAEARRAIIRHSTRRAAALLGALCVIACYSDTQEHFNFDDGISNPNSNAIAATVIHTSVESPNGLGKIMNGDARKIQTPSVKIYVIDLKTAAIRNSWSFNNEVGLGAQYRAHIDGFLGDDSLFVTLQYCTEIVCDGITKYIEKHYLMVTGNQPVRIDTLPMLYYALSWNAPCRGGPPCPFFYPHGDSLTTWDSSVGGYRALFMTRQDNTISAVRNP